MYIPQLLNERCYRGNHEIKGDFCSFEYFHILIIPNTPMWIFKLNVLHDIFTIFSDYFIS